MLAPGGHYLIEVLEDNLTHFAPQPWGAIEFKFFGDNKIVRQQPILAFRIFIRNRRKTDSLRLMELASSYKYGIHAGAAFALPF